MITINGKTYSGNNVTMIGNKIIIDGKEVGKDSKTINITVDGDIAKDLDLSSASKVVVNGNVAGNVKSTNGNITCHNVGGSVMITNGDVSADEIKGNVDTNNGSISKKFRLFGRSK